ncbi:cytochrome c oxidase subunit II [Schlesneria sp. DSM 10557]|uniref:cytochrome c oxidase subunit II n=1 Tax=Schlesneria sp. DSM 10557 TaxID=3044399 RepID=UPI00359FAF52
MGKFWAVFFTLTSVIIFIVSWMSPAMQWWFPGDHKAYSTLGGKIDDLFYLILVIVSVTFVGTSAALGYALWKGAAIRPDEKVWFSHGSHSLEVIWTIVPSAILLFIALYQLDVWAEYRMKAVAKEMSSASRPMIAVAEVTARQFEWRIRYPANGKTLKPTPQPDDVYTVNELHVPTGALVSITLRTDDVQHAFFVPELRVKQDAVPGKMIPVWFDATAPRSYELLCAELCGWGHYKMKAVLVAQSEDDFDAWKEEASARQFDDGYRQPAE